LICENTAFILPSVEEFSAVGIISDSGGGGGGGGGGGPPGPEGGAGAAGADAGGRGDVAAVNVGELVPMKVSAGEP